MMSAEEQREMDRLKAVNEGLQLQAKKKDEENYHLALECVKLGGVNLMLKEEIERLRKTLEMIASYENEPPERMGPIAWAMLGHAQQSLEDN